MQGSYVEDSSSREELLARNEQLEKELARCREDVQRMRTLFDSMATYAQKAREGSPHDVESPQYVNSEAERLAAAMRDLERTEADLDRERQELARLRALTAETRRRLSTFVAASLDGLNSVSNPHDDQPSHERQLDDPSPQWLPPTQTVTTDGQSRAGRPLR